MNTFIEATQRQLNSASGIDGTGVTFRLLIVSLKRARSCGLGSDDNTRNLVGVEDNGAHHSRSFEFESLV